MRRPRRSPAPRAEALEARPLRAALADAVAPADAAEVRPEPWGGGRGLTDDSAALQGLIDATPAYGTLALPPGTYLISQPLFLTKPITLTTQGIGDAGLPYDPMAGGVLDLSPYAVIKASPALAFGGEETPANQELGVVVVRPPDGQATVSGVHLDHIAIDGNSEGRSWAERLGNQFDCSNVNFHRADDSSMTDCVSLHALGHGWDPYSNIFVDCNNLVIAGNLLLANGDVPVGADPPGYFGSTHGNNTLEVQALGRDASIRVVNNRVIDSSALGIVTRVGPGRTMVGEVAGNVIAQYATMSWGVGILLYGEGSYGDGSRADPAAALLVHDNVIDGNAGGATIPGTRTRLRQIPYGIMLGIGPYADGGDPLLWDVSGGRVYDNTIRNVQVGINLGGAGTPASPVFVLDNAVGGNTGLGFNKAPETAFRPPDVVAAHAGLRWSGGRLVQDGPVALFGAGARPSGWSALSTYGNAYGASPPVSLVAPKPFARVSTLRLQATAGRFGAGRERESQGAKARTPDAGFRRETRVI
jgi:hypothetical protein